ncbi:hypothetical protein ACFB49_42580 [Sphingomonas sp. DBB INV C78]|uniref:hypothetical protein n=1 Tax=Sphingomonas sp. DBB INV C78 TaxID=3349434 RepID=UPI0036D21981
MKFVKLLTHAYVGGVLRSPAEGVLHIEDDEAEKLFENKAAEDVTDDFTAKENREAPVEHITVVDGASETPPEPEPHQSEVAPQADEPKKPASRKAAGSKE